MDVIWPLAAHALFYYQPVEPRSSALEYTSILTLQHAKGLAVCGCTVPGRPRATALNRVIKAEFDRARMLVETMSAATFNRDSLMFRPLRKEGDL